MPILDVTLVEGRSAEDKKKLIAALTKAVEESMGYPPRVTRILLKEIPAEHWGVAGVTLPEFKAEREAKEAAAG